MIQRMTTLTILCVMGKLEKRSQDSGFENVTTTKK